MYWDAASHDAGYTHRFSIRNLSRYDFGLSRIPSLTHLTADGIGHLANVRFLLHGADGVGHFLNDGVRLHRANSVRHLASTRFATIRTNGIGDSATTALLASGTDGIRHLLGSAFFDYMTRCVRHSTSLRDRHHFADLIGNSAGLRFLNHASRHDRSLFSFRHPDLLAGHRSWAVNLLIADATGAIDLSATITVPFPTTGRLDATIASGARALFYDSSPFAAANINLLAFNHWAADGVANIAIAGIRARFVGRIALFPVASLIHGFANFVADVFVAGLIRRHTDGIGFIAVASARKWNLHRVLLAPPSSLLHRFAHGVALVSVAHLIHRLASFVALVTELRFVDVASASNGNLFADGITDRAVLSDTALVVDDILHRLVTGAASACRAKIAAG